MDGDEIDRVIDVARAQPEFPDIGIGHRHAGLAFHIADGRGEILRGHFAAQQHLVADDERADHVGILLGEPDRRVDLDLVFCPALPDSQMPCMTFKPWRLAISAIRSSPNSTA